MRFTHVGAVLALVGAITIGAVASTAGADTGAPVITTQPASQTVSPGATAVFQSFANGTPAPTVAWQASLDGGSSWNDIGVTSNTLNVANVTSAQNGNQYRAVFTNGAGTVTSNAAVLTVGQSPGNIVVTTGPKSQTVPAGATASFNASATGNPTPTVEWEVSTNKGMSWSATGVTAATLTLTNVATTQNGNQYRAVFNNSTGSVPTAPATLTVTGSPAPTVTLPPAIVGQAYSVTLTAAGGKPPLTWVVTDGALPPGLTLSKAGVLAGTPTGSPGSATFSVQVTDSSSPAEVASETAKLIVKPATTNTCPLGNVAFVCQTYIDLLGRSPQSNEVSLWVGAVNANAISREGVAAAIATSPEYRLNLVRTFFATYLHRVPDVQGLLNLSGLLNAGIPDETIVAGMLGSPEYFAKAGSANDKFLHALYTDLLSRSPDAASVSSWQQLLAAGTTRTDAAQSILNSPEYRGDLVAGDFQHLLGRPVDPGGLAAWVSALEGGVTDEQVVSGIAGSQEYFNRAQRR